MLLSLLAKVAAGVLGVSSQDTAQNSADVPAADPNILFILTDDQDQLLDSMRPDGPCQTILNGIGNGNGTIFNNAFVSTPICCPSRAEITTGRYMHNTKVFGNTCGGMDFIDGPEKENVAATLKAAKPQYRTFYAGKYLNNYGAKNVGGVARIPPGWDQWYGLVGNSKYYSYSVSNNGIEEVHGEDYAKDYFTDRVANRSLEFMQWALTNNHPFFMQVATPASHGPNTPAPQYNETYAGLKSPRLPSWNVTGQQDKSYLLRTIIPIDERHANVSDVYFQRRWSVLRSVDDMVGKFLKLLADTGALNSTYIIYTSDNGFHLGEFGMLYDKRMLYETDIHIPLLARGPGIAKSAHVDFAAVHVDLAPTILDMAGVAPLPTMDGRSWLPMVQASAALHTTATANTTWRTQFMVEYSGGNALPNTNDSVTLLTFEHSCHAKPAKESCAGTYWPKEFGHENDVFGFAVNREAACGAKRADELSISGKCSCSVHDTDGEEHDKSPCDGRNNTYACVRTLTEVSNEIYCEFNDPEHFVEWYNLTADPYNLHNLAPSASPDALATQHATLLKHQTCRGQNCFM